MQFHPVTDAPEHVDFQRLAAGEPIRVSVPVHFENDGLSPGLKRGGVLNVVRHAVEVYCDAGEHPGAVHRRSWPGSTSTTRALAGPEGTENTPPGDRTATSWSRPSRRRPSMAEVAAEAQPWPRRRRPGGGRRNRPLRAQAPARERR